MTADPVAGLRAWALKGNDRLIATAPIFTDKEGRSAGPTALSIDGKQSRDDRVNISVGYDDGSFAIFTLKRNTRRFIHRYLHAASSNGPIHAIAYASPYVLTMTGAPLLSLYRFGHEPAQPFNVLKLSVDGVKKVDSSSAEEPIFLGKSFQKSMQDDLGSCGAEEERVDYDATMEPPTLISSLRSQTAYPPISLAIRASLTSIVASIAYAMPTWTSGWSVGLQEIRISSGGAIINSRMTSAATQDALSPPPNLNLRTSIYNNGTTTLDQQVVTSVRLALGSKPTSLSYNHPYLLSSHADNTLTLYMVTSNTEELSIGVGSRLWGHTSSVSGAHVGDRGKAVSVSAVGNELRVWELEGGMTSNTSRRRAAAGEASVRVCPERIDANSKTKTENMSRAHIGAVTVPRLIREQEADDSSVTHGWVAFDEEKVVLLREKMLGTQALVVYDFE